MSEINVKINRLTARVAELEGKYERLKDAAKLAASTVAIHQWGYEYCPDCGCLEGEGHDVGCWVDEVLALLRVMADVALAAKGGD